MNAIVFAYCFRSGEIGFTNNEDEIPNGVIVFAVGNDEEIRAQAAAKARLAYDGTTLLVPGVPEASEGEAFPAFVAWHTWAFPDEGWIMNSVVDDML